MKITADSFGMLVRPRIMSYARILPRPNAISESEKWNLHALINASLYGEKEINSYKQSYEDLFDGLNMGDTSKDLSDCYVGVITSFITSINRHYVLVTKDNFKEISEKIFKRHQTRKTLPVHFVGIKFYKGLKRNEQGKLEPVDPWHITSGTHEWFYRRWDLIPMETIVSYESINLGNLVIFKRTRGFAAKIKTINKKKFYKTNSWSVRSIIVLMGNGKTFLRFLPNKNFKRL